MIRRLRGACGVGTSRHAADAAVGRGMADVLAALDNVIDDDVALGRVFGQLRASMPGTAPPLTARTAAARTAADKPSAPAGRPDPADTTAPAGGPAASQRRLALRAAAAAGAALAAAAVALVAVIVPGAGRNSSGGLADDTAYVVKRVYTALSAAGPGAVAQMTVTARSAGVSGGTTTATTTEEWSYDDRWRAVTYSAARQYLYDEGFSATSAYTVVDYRTRTWARQHGSDGPARLAPGQRGCGQAGAPLPLPQSGLPGGLSAGWQPTTVAEALRAAVSCGTLTVAGRQRVDAVTAIKLTSRPDSVISETVWVSPGTYLPVRVVIRPAAGQQGPWQTADITWLPPTAQNLARLTVPIPAGFRRIPLARATAPILQHIRVWTKA
jgi:hypothetical protein